MTIHTSMASTAEKQSPNGASKTPLTVPAAKLLGITRTGPIYLTRADLVLLSVPVYLAFVQELALRSMKPKAKVVSTVARRVGGDHALLAWHRTCALIGPQLTHDRAH